MKISIWSFLGQASPTISKLDVDSLGGSQRNFETSTFGIKESLRTLRLFYLTLYVSQSSDQASPTLCQTRAQTYV